MSARLEPIIQATRSRVDERKRATSLGELERAAAAAAAPRGFRAALGAPGVALIAEHKRRSPSAGRLTEGGSVGDVVSAYERGGAAALSILTESDHFGGSLEDLAEARRATHLPILRKDFTVDPYQVYEARAHGADAVLLVVGTLSRPDLERLHHEAEALSLDAIVEVYDAQELDVALELGAPLIGINNRNLEDFSVDIARTRDLFPTVGAGHTVISESGIFTPADVAELGRIGVDAVLVGEALMRAADVAAACRDLATAST